MTRKKPRIKTANMDAFMGDPYKCFIQVYVRGKPYIRFDGDNPRGTLENFLREWRKAGEELVEPENIGLEEYYGGRTLPVIPVKQEQYELVGMGRAELVLDPDEPYISCWRYSRFRSQEEYGDQLRLQYISKNRINEEHLRSLKIPNCTLRIKSHMGIQMTDDDFDLVRKDRERYDWCD